MGNITELSQGNLDGLKKQVCECIDHAKAQGYKEGYEKGENDADKDLKEIQDSTYDAAYNTAINDYNKTIQQLHECKTDFISFLAEVYSCDLSKEATTTGSILYEIIPRWGMREVIDKFKKWQEQKKQAEEEIKVGDEVITFGGSKAIVTRVEDTNIRLFYSDGSGGRFDNNVEIMEKTGRNFSAEVSQLLDKLKGDKE